MTVNQFKFIFWTLKPTHLESKFKPPPFYNFVVLGLTEHSKMKKIELYIVMSLLYIDIQQ